MVVLAPPGDGSKGEGSGVLVLRWSEWAAGARAGARARRDFLEGVAELERGSLDRALLSFCVV